MAKKRVRKLRSKSVAYVKPKSSVWNYVWWTLGILVLIVILFFVVKGITGNAVSPITGDVVNDPFLQIFGSIGQQAQPVLEYLIGYKMNTSGTDVFGDFFSMALLILIIVFSVVFLVIKEMPFFDNSDHAWATWLVSIAVSLLAVRFLTQQWLLTILLPYSTLGIVIAAGLPFVLFYFLVSKFPHKAGKIGTLQRIAWVFFGIVFVYLWYDRANSGDASNAYYTIYLWTALAALFMAVIGQWLANKGQGLIDEDKAGRSASRKKLEKIEKDLHEKEAHYKARMDTFSVGTPEYNEASKMLEEVMSQLDKVYAAQKALGKDVIKGI